MANQEDIKKYLIGKGTKKPYLHHDNSNGKILMLSGVWGSGKTHFWRNEVELEIFTQLELEKQNKSYIFISLYGKDSIEELQNEIQQLSYNFSVKNSIATKKNPKYESSKNIISSTFSVFTKVGSFIPTISVKAFGIGMKINPGKTAEKLEKENIKQQIEKGVGRLKDGGIICFDDFERKSSKIDLNDLFGFITNLTEEFQTKTIIITNQEFFQENDAEVFNRIKEKSVNKFLLLNPTVEELFNTVYTEEYKNLDTYKAKILDAIKDTKEKNARIFIQVLDNCLEYKESVKDENEIFMLVLITVLFVKYNIVFKMEEIPMIDNPLFLPIIIKNIPPKIFAEMLAFKTIEILSDIQFQSEFINLLKVRLENSKDRKEEVIKEEFIFIDNNRDILFQLYKYIILNKYFTPENKILIDKLNNFVETGILLEDDAKK